MIFVARIEGDKRQEEGYCLVCAKELGIKEVDNILSRMGISEDDVENMSDQITEMMGEDENFAPGGSALFPQFMQNLSGNLPAKELPKPDEKQGSVPKSDKREKANAKDEKTHKFLNTYCTNLTQRAREDKMDRIIGRDREISRMVQILSRRQKNNPCLIGEPGVGKTAIVEGLAQRVVEGKVPFVLQKKEIFLVDLAALVAGTQFRGQFEGRIKSLIDEVRTDGNVILFIDEVHNLAGAGDATEGSMNAANIMKPALSRGEIQVIGATTFKEYRKYIEKDAALERRFQPIVVEEPSIEETINVLNGLRGYYEVYHGVTVSPALIKRTVELSERYITDRFLPDKAIDLLDEAAAFASLKSTELQTFRKLSAEMSALKKEETEVENAEDSVDYERLAILKAELIRLEGEVKTLEPAANAVSVTEDDIASVVELWTGIDASKIHQSDISKLATLEKQLKERVKGQDEAVEALAAAMRRSRMRLYEKERPTSFIFAGPTGVGKTELVKVLAKSLFDTPDSLIRIDMSEYMEKHAVARLIGAPPGYVGYDEAGQLTEKVRRKPYSVILFDEIEKAHPDIMHILLQILDDGRVTDAQGRNISFANTVIVMTTNAGSDNKENALGFAKSAATESEAKVKKALSEFLRPEFLGRIDEVIVFKSLSHPVLVAICDLMLHDIKTSLAEQNVTFGWTPEVCEWIASKSDSGKYGARELRKIIRKEVEDRIASKVIDSTEGMPGMIKVDIEQCEGPEDTNDNRRIAILIA